MALYMSFPRYAECWWCNLTQFPNVGILQDGVSPCSVLPANYSVIESATHPETAVLSRLPTSEAGRVEAIVK